MCQCVSFAVNWLICVDFGPVWPPLTVDPVKSWETGCETVPKRLDGSWTGFEKSKRCVAFRCESDRSDYKLGQFEPYPKTEEMPWCVYCKQCAYVSGLAVQESVLKGGCVGVDVHCAWR